MTVQLPDGSSYVGPFFQIRSVAEADWSALQPLWYGWPPGWTDWPYWGPSWGLPPARSFVTRYSGKVVANLSSISAAPPPGKRQLRCRLHLADPSISMNGGGQGECQFENGEVLNATFSS
jgi:hypothetical protein